MKIELASPAYLGLAAIALDDTPCLLGITLRHPQIHLLARPANGLQVTGARADLAYAQASRFYTHHNLSPAAEIEIDLAIPSSMGLGSAPLMGLTVARALAELHGLPTTVDELASAVGVDDALAIHAFDGGGLLAIDRTGKPLRRHAIVHNEERRDWVFVFVLPRTTPHSPSDQEEARRHTTLMQAVPPATSVGDALWAAVEHDNIGAFATALSEAQMLNNTILAERGEPVTLSEKEADTLAVMRDNGALLCGRAPGGEALYALIEGGGPSRTMRAALTKHLGYMGGMVMATICDPGGVRG